MQATRDISYGGCGRRVRNINWVVDGGRSVENGLPLDSTLSARLQSWLDADGSSQGRTWPTPTPCAFPLVHC